MVHSACALRGRNGTIQRASPTENQELFHLVVGGYGLFGIVLDADLDVTDNVIYTTGRQVIDYRAFPDLFANELAGDTSLGLFYGHLSTSPGSLLVTTHLPMSAGGRRSKGEPASSTGKVSSYRYSRR